MPAKHRVLIMLPPYGSELSWRSLLLKNGFLQFQSTFLGVTLFPTAMVLSDATRTMKFAECILEKDCPMNTANLALPIQLNTPTASEKKTNNRVAAAIADGSPHTT